MQWFRFYSEALDDPKVQRLPGDLFKAWVNLLCLANLQEERGTLPSIEDIGFRLRMDDGAVATLLVELARRGLLDDEYTGYRIHGWQSRQYRSDTDPTATDRKRRQRSRDREEKRVTRDTSVTSRTMSQNVTRTESESDTEAETDQIQKEKQTRQRAPRPLRPTIDSYEPDPTFLETMHEERPDLHLPDVIENWRDYHREHGKNPKDHTASLRRWIRNEKTRPTVRAPVHAIPTDGRPVGRTDGMISSDVLNWSRSRREANR